ncbi:MAG TPA: peptidylprolyl isomerase [Oculatellaceae cyanobacterium]|jgi:FKBP-type peptidyl-prolyl cis-trans isomerase SlyD
MATEMITSGKVVSMNYILTDAAGKVLDSSEGEPLEYLQGYNNIIPGLERALEGLKPGDKKQVVVQPQDGYGERNADLQFTLPLAQFGGQVPQPGMMVQIQSDQGVMMATIVHLQGEHVLMDANHPLAGQTLHFDVEIVGVRGASEEEILHGHPHGPNGHHH